MQGFKSYLFIAVILGGAIWLFWGKALQTGWKKATDARPANEKSTAVTVAKKLPEALAKSKLPAVNAAQEWQKTQSGVTSLLSLQTQESRIGLARQIESHDKRMIEILRAMKFLRDPAQPVKAAEPQLVKPSEPVKKTVEKRPPKSGEQRRATSEERRPSKLRPIL